MEENEGLPENLRCKRTDGRQWRCKRRVWEDKSLCENHYHQGKLRNNKEKVPDELKFQRAKTNTKRQNREPDGPQDEEIGARKIEKVPNPRPAKRRRNVVLSEVLDSALRKWKLKKGDPQLDLVREFLKREVEKRKERDLKGEREKAKELTRELPYGVMAIAPPSPLQELHNVSSYCHVKVGVEPSTTLRRCFRSKNIEPIPISTKQIVPYASNVAKLKKKNRKKCHWCRQSCYRTFIQCSKCKKQYFCLDCIQERPDVTKEQIKEACPVCQKSCACRACSRSSPTNDIEEVCLENLNVPEVSRKETDVFDMKRLEYIINMLLPALGDINQEQQSEMEYEAKKQGKTVSLLNVELVDISRNKPLRCNNCQTFVVDLHRRCRKCSYNLCLGCLVFFRDQRYSSGFEDGEESMSRFRRHQEYTELLLKRLEHRIPSRKGLRGGRLCTISVLPTWKACNNDGSIICPPTACGGCGEAVLGLASIFPVGYIEKLAANAKQIISCYDAPQIIFVSPCCSICNSWENRGTKRNVVMSAASREDSFDNYLYYPPVKDIQNEKIEHFQYHWGKGEPVIIRDVLKSKPELSWDPIEMFSSYLEKSSTRSQNNKEAGAVTDRLDWIEMEVHSKQKFVGSLRGGSISYESIWYELLTLKVWLSACSFQELFPVHHAEVIHSLPLQGYMNPQSGLYNLAANHLEDAKKPTLGPFLHISFGSSADLKQDDFLTKLFHESHDMVNILVHATDSEISSEKLTEIKNLMKKCNTQDREPPTLVAPEQRNENVAVEKSLVISKNTESRLQNLPDKEITLPNGTSQSSRVNGHSQTTRRSSAKDADVSNGFRDCNENDTCSEEESEADTCGAQWDIFRREDVPQLAAYLTRQSEDLRDMHRFSPSVGHPLLGRCFYLDATQKKELKKDFGIEPWTFEQRPGEAVVIPAGCPYQIRRLKCCVNVVLNFISPESITESISLNDALCLLPKQHEARKNVLEVQGMTVDSISNAVVEMRSLEGAN